MNKMYDLNSKFDIELHKKNFPFYFEAFIFSDGSVEYAVPSHQEFLIKKYCEQFKTTREKFYKVWDFRKMIDELGVICCWYDNSIFPARITLNQFETLQKLIDNEIMALRRI